MDSFFNSSRCQGKKKTPGTLRAGKATR